MAQLAATTRSIIVEREWLDGLAKDYGKNLHLNLNLKLRLWLLKNVYVGLSHTNQIMIPNNIPN